MDEKTRISVDLGAKDAAALRELVEEYGAPTKAEALRRAIRDSLVAQRLRDRPDALVVALGA